MHVCTDAECLLDGLSSERSAGKHIGFVPTMGALHTGHLSLIDAARNDNDIVVCSVFVNRAQFNDSSDFDRYPRMPEKDLQMLEKGGCHIAFLPSEEEVFPGNWQAPDIDFGIMETVMEGKYRPGHFKGMIKVVHRLFEMIRPDAAYFGEKDFQQLALIRKLASLLHPKIKVVGCPTIREPDGLAMSSRNMLLTPDQRAEAPFIYHTLCEAGIWLKRHPVETVKGMVEESINSTNYLRLQYFEVVDPNTLASLEELKGDARLCIAVLTAGPRLIDNVAVSAGS